ncbi:MAG: 4-oxalocrotonate tautomerase family protein [Nitrospinota bacterium]
MPVAHITLLEGRPKEAKAKIADEVAESISKHGGAPKQGIIVIFHDVTQDDWATGGVLFSDRQAAAPKT